MTKQRYFLIMDGHALIYRAFHAFPDLTTKEGLLVNAVYGFSRNVLTAIRDYQPTFMAVAFDRHGPTFRHQNYAEYKAHREAMPETLRPQIEIVKEVVRTLNIPQFEAEGFEADDLIGSMSCQLHALNGQENLMTVIVTGDRDTFQLVNDCTHVWLPGRGKNQEDKEYDREGVKQKMGVYPDQIVDLKALMGDASDNIPGVRGVGEKTAVKLIETFDTLTGVYEAVDKWRAGDEAAGLGVLKASLVEKLVADKDNALLSQQLATIDCDAPVKLTLEDCRVSSYDKEGAMALFEKMDFKSLIRLLPADEFELGVQNALF